MGLYDTILVAESLLSALCRENNITIKSYNGYYDFQTKDLDNILTIFHIESDGSFNWLKQECEYVEPDKDSKEKWKFGRMVPLGPPEKIEDTRSTYIDFYDFYNTEEDRCFVTFTAHVKNGKLSEPIILKSIERTNLKDEDEKHKKSREQWSKVQATWQWKLATFISNTQWKLQKMFYPFVYRLNNFETRLRDKAKSLHERAD